MAGRPARRPVLSPRKLYSLCVTDAQAAGLKAIKAAEDMTESEQIRQALNAGFGSGSGGE